MEFFPAEIERREINPAEVHFLDRLGAALTFRLTEVTGLALRN